MAFRLTHSVTHSASFDGSIPIFEHSVRCTSWSRDHLPNLHQYSHGQRDFLPFEQNSNVYCICLTAFMYGSCGSAMNQLQTRTASQTSALVLVGWMSFPTILLVKVAFSVDRCKTGLQAATPKSMYKIFRTFRACEGSRRTTFPPFLPSAGPVEVLASVCSSPKWVSAWFLSASTNTYDFWTWPKKINIPKPLDFAETNVSSMH